MASEWKGLEWSGVEWGGVVPSRLQYPGPMLLKPLILSRLQYSVPELQAVVVPAAPVLRQYPNGRWCGVLIAIALTPLLKLNGAKCGTSE